MSSKFILKKSSSGAAAKDSVVAEYVFDGSLFTIGSEPGGTVVLAEAAPEQAVIIREGEQLKLINSAEGTNLNGRLLRREAIEPLAFGDEIKVGDHVLALVSAVDASGENGNGGATLEESVREPAFAAQKETGFFQTQNASANLPAKKSARNFADILNSLRTEEDSFYFVVENSKQTENRIPLEQAEIPLGVNAKGEISWHVEQIKTLYAIVRKDWSGIIVETQRGAAVFVNDETLATTRRLRNGDRVSFNAASPNKKSAPFLKLHEPSSLVALESLLENRARGEGIQKNLNGAIHSSESETVVSESSESLFERRFFGYFNFFEIVSMVIGTLIGAVLIFLALEFSVG